MRHFRLEARADNDAAAAIGGEAGGFEVEALGVALAADAEQHRLAEDALAAFELDRRRVEANTPHVGDVLT